MAAVVLSPFRVTVWLLLIFTPPTQQTQVRRSTRAEPHDRSGDEAEAAFWAQLIEHLGTRDVILLDSFELLAHRPTFGRQLFARLGETGRRVSVRRHLSRASPLPPTLHRLAIIVPIVMKPSTATGSTLRKLFKQIDQESYFLEFYDWLFVVGHEHTAEVRRALRKLPVRADSSIYCVSYPEPPTSGDHTVQHGWKILTEDRPVRRMQTILPGPVNRTGVELTLPTTDHQQREESCRSGVRNHTVSIQQLYRLQTRTKTIDVWVELLGTRPATERTDGAEQQLVLYRSRGVEQRNDFFNLAQLTIRVYSSAAPFINSTFIAQSMQLFRNARIEIHQSNLFKNGRTLKFVDFHFRLVAMSHYNRRMHALFAYSVPILHDHLNLYIHYANIDYEQRSSQFFVVVLLPVAGMGALLSLSLLVTFNLLVDRAETSLTVADSLLWFIGVIAQQGSLVRPNSLSTMLLIMATLCFSSIMYCTYLTRITSELSVDVETSEYLDDLLENNEYKIGIVGNVSKGQTIAGEKIDSAIMEVLERMRVDKTLYAFSYEDGIERVLKSKYALIGLKGIVRKTMENLDENNNCEITELKLAGIDQFLALQMQSKYIYRKMINYEILRCFSNGLVARITKHMIPPKRWCVQNKKFQNINIQHTKKHMYLLATGTVLSVLILGCELFYFYAKKFRYLQKQQDKTNRMYQQRQREKK